MASKKLNHNNYYLILRFLTNWRQVWSGSMLAKNLACQIIQLTPNECKIIS